MQFKFRYYFVLLIFFLTSCSSKYNFVKRKYESGYYVDFYRTNKQQPPIINATQYVANNNTVDEDKKDKTENNDESTLASTCTIEIKSAEKSLKRFKEYNKTSNFNKSNIRKQYYLKCFSSDTLIVNKTSQKDNNTRPSKLKKIVGAILSILVWPIYVLFYICKAILDILKSIY